MSTRSERERVYYINKRRGRWIRTRTTLVAVVAGEDQQGPPNEREGARPCYRSMHTHTLTLALLYRACNVSLPFGCVCLSLIFSPFLIHVLTHSHHYSTVYVHRHQCLYRCVYTYNHTHSKRAYATCKSVWIILRAFGNTTDVKLLGQH